MIDTDYRLTPVAAPTRPFSVHAVVAFVLSLTPFFGLYDARMPVISHLFALLAVLSSVLFGIVALRRINKDGHNGQVLATAGLAICGIMSAWFALEIAYGL